MSEGHKVVSRLDESFVGAVNALDLLRYIVTVEEWVKNGDERARPFLDADAVRLENGEVSFHQVRFLETARKHLTH